MGRSNDGDGPESGARLAQLRDPSRQILSEKTPRQDESVFSGLREIGQAAAMRSVPELVLMLHCDSAFELDLQQHGEEFRPVHEALSGDAVTPPSLTGNPHLLQDRLNDLSIFGMHGENAALNCHATLTGSMYCRTKCEGSNSSPSRLLGTRSKIACIPAGMLAKLSRFG